MHSKATLASLICAILGGAVAHAQSQLPTVDQAIALSQKTGRPIFAMAGQKT